jgi:hypothetical protein
MEFEDKNLLSEGSSLYADLDKLEKLVISMTDTSTNSGVLDSIKRIAN